MKRIIYCSQATQDFGPDELVGLLEAARASNERAGLTGMVLSPPRPSASKTARP